MSCLKVPAAVACLGLLSACASHQSASNGATSSNTATYSYDAEALSAYDSTFTFPGTKGKRPKRSSRSLRVTSSYGPPVRARNLKPRSNRKKPYFIEFRARNALSYGHTFVVFGVRDKNGKVPTNKKGVLIPGTVEVAGLHPSSDNPAQFTAGHIIPVPALTGPSDGDTEEAYVTARYRINLTAKEFDYVVKKVRARKLANNSWYAPVYACVQFTNSLAKDLGLKTPKSPHLPKGFTNYLKANNGSSLPPMKKS